MNLNRFEHTTTHPNPAFKPRTRGKKHAGKKDKGYAKAALIVGTTALYVGLSAFGSLNEWYKWAYFNLAMSGEFGLILKWVIVCILLPILLMLSSVNIIWDAVDAREESDD
jgi:uncharacterized membrane protein YhdT